MEFVTSKPNIDIDEAKFWQVVLARDEHHAGEFVYGVRSTGIYCRPGCPARQPNRDQVTFFSSNEEAEMAGYRPCKRCRPRETPTSVEIVQQACRIIDARTEAAPTLAELSQELAISPTHLHRLFKSVTGLTPHQYLAGQKARQFKDLVREGEAVSGALYEAGYGSSSRLYENAAGRLGMTPGSYRKGGEGMEIRYTIVDTFIGRMLVAATERGVCAVTFGNDDALLESLLQKEYPKASIQRDEQAFSAWVQTLLIHLEGRQPNLELPLDVQATAFQLQVWEELRKIPYGEKRTYTEVAQAIGRPAAVRAVASACAANPTAVVTPCHRVLRSDGSLGGYRWGLERKEALLEKERVSKGP